MIDRNDTPGALSPASALKSSVTGVKAVILLAILFCLPTLLSGCTAPGLYEDDPYNPPVYWGRHVVREGETLYSIAWRYGRDYRELGSANGIKPPYNIYRGQVLRLDLQGSVPSGSAQASTGNNPAAGRPAASRPPASQSRQRAGSTGSSRTPSSSPLPPVTLPADSDIAWRWPHTGTVLAGFSKSGKLNKGIDIDGRPGDPIRAAAAGQVVYAGSGLLGYGNLIILNHSEHFLSAYAHNRKIMVAEGETVKQGQVIAEMGSSGTDTAKLHFEIRRNGDPVDPMRYLPAR